MGFARNIVNGCVAIAFLVVVIGSDFPLSADFDPHSCDCCQKGEFDFVKKKEANFSRFCLLFICLNVIYCLFFSSSLTKWSLLWRGLTKLYPSWWITRRAVSPDSFIPQVFLIWYFIRRAVQLLWLYPMFLGESFSHWSIKFSCEVVCWAGRPGICKS